MYNEIGQSDERQGRVDEESSDNDLNRLRHDFKNPINVIVGFSSLLKNDAFGPLNTKQREFVAAIEKAAGELLAIVESLPRSQR